VIENLRAFRDTEQECIKEIVKSEDYMTWNIEDFTSDDRVTEVGFQRNHEMEHSIVDFQKVIIGEKVRGYQDKGFKNINFNDEHLSKILYIPKDSHLKFYSLETIRKLIDFQFVKTKEFLQILFLFYVFCFMIPFILTLSIED